MHVKVSEARGNYTIIQFGPTLQADPAAKYTVFACVYDRDNPASKPEMKVVKKGKVPRKGRVRVKLERMVYHTVIAQGEDVAGTVHTSDCIMAAPFHLSIDAPPSPRRLEQQRQEQLKARRMSKRKPLGEAIRAALFQRR